MAIRTRMVDGQSVVFHGRIRDDLSDVAMAVETQLGKPLHQKSPLPCVVRVVTVGAFLSSRSVNYRITRHHLLDLSVTVEADVVDFLFQSARRCRIVAFMAKTTGASLVRSVNPNHVFPRSQRRTGFGCKTCNRHKQCYANHRCCLENSFCTHDYPLNKVRDEARGFILKHARARATTPPPATQ